MVIFKSKQKKFEGDLNVKLCCERLYPNESVKHVRVKIDTNLNCNIIWIYFAVFDSYFYYCCLEWSAKALFNTKLKNDTKLRNYAKLKKIIPN